MNHLAANAIYTRHYDPVAPKIPSVVAGLDYVKSPNSKNVFQFMYEPEGGAPPGSAQFEKHMSTVIDARCLSHYISLHEQGFQLWDAPSRVQNYRDWETIKTIYYQEMSELACLATGAKEAFVFDHLVRKREEDRRSLSFGRMGDGSRPAPAGRVHNDYTEESGLKWLGQVIKDTQKAKSVKRFGIVNIWRSINGPALDAPLAVCDARTVSARDFVSCDIHYPDRTGNIYLALPSSQHEWYYYSAMGRHEALVFKQYDTQVSGTARFTLHTAFEHPDTPKDWPLRESIELRCLVIYE